jgi:hypothetical protein
MPRCLLARQPSDTHTRLPLSPPLVLAVACPALPALAAHSSAHHPSIHPTDNPNCPACSSSIPFNPGYSETSWATEWNQDFVADHSDPNIDFAAIHIWPGTGEQEVDHLAPLIFHAISSFIRWHAVWDGC